MALTYPQPLRQSALFSVIERSQAGEARRQAVNWAENQGCSKDLQGQLALVITELGTNNIGIGSVDAKVNGSYAGRQQAITDAGGKPLGELFGQRLGRAAGQAGGAGGERQGGEGEDGGEHAAKGEVLHAAEIGRAALKKQVSGG